ITVTDNVTIYVVKNPEKAKFELTLTVYDGDKAPVVAADGKVVTGTKGESKMDEGGKTFTPWTYEITEGASVRVRGSVELNEGNYEIGEDKIPVKVVTVGGEKEATFNMPASAFALDLTVDESEMNVVYEITINGDMEASWKMEDTDEATPLSKGTNTVPEGAKITITAVKDGQGILVDKTAYKATGAAGENKEDILKTIYDETPVTIEVKNAPIALYSAVKVVNETSVDAAAGDVTIEKTSDQRADSESEAVYWVAAGQEVTLNAETGKSYFTNADKGKETSKVSPWSGTSLTKASGQVKFTVSGNETIHILEGYKVTASEGITLTLESGVTESKTTETLPNVVYVKKGTEVSVKSASGTKVTKLNGVTEFACMSDESDKVVSGGKVTVNDGDITLNLAYQVTFGEGVEEAYWATGELTAEGKGNVLFPKPEPKAENNTKVAYALKGAWIMAQGETVEPKVTGAVENSAKKVGVKSTVFQVGETAVSVLISDAEATNETSKETGTFESVLANAVDGDVITLNKEVKLESRITLDKNITLNLNGHEIDGSTVARAIDVKGNVKIKDGAVIGKTSENDLGTIYVYDNATLNLENVNVTGMGCIFVGTYYSSVTTSGVQTATLNITGGTLTTSAKSFSDFAAISTGGNQQNGTHIITAKGTTIIGGGVEALYLPGVADVTLTDCTVTGANGISIKSGELNLKGTTSVTGTSENGSITDSNLNNNGSNETGAAISIFGQTPTYKGHITVNIDKTVTLKGNAKENGKTYEIVIAGTGETGESWSGPQLWIDGDRVTGGEANGWNIRQLKTGNSGNGNSGSNGSTGTESGGESEG
ncbi:MAG: hypothetical protein HFF38_07525, partial [Lawsonibacter sp.]|nr:hypothetical protein [Lawsonibacter sp.]